MSQGSGVRKDRVHLRLNTIVGFLYDFLTNSLLPFYGAPNLIEITLERRLIGAGMIRFFLILCALAEGFLLWFLVVLIRESRHRAPDKRDADRPRSQRGSRSEDDANGAGCIVVLQ